MTAIRRAGLADAALLAAVHEAAFDDAWDAASFARLLQGPGALALVAETGGGPAGLVLFHSVPPEAELLSIGVAPDHRRQGWALRLLARAVPVLAAQGVETLFLDVAASNAPAQALYARLGFARTGRRLRYYRNGDDALLLTAPLTAVRAALSSSPE
jgi:[ribosomal protein S18]-alanine N-acetyltransferase